MAARKTKRTATKRRKTTSRPLARKKTTSTTKTTARRPSTKRKTTSRKRRTTTTSASSSSGSAHISGRFDGDITAKGHIHIAPGAICKGSVTAKHVEIDGTVRGSVSAHHTFKLGSKAKFEGEFTTTNFMAADGASFKGFCQFGRFKKAA